MVAKAVAGGWEALSGGYKGLFWGGGGFAADSHPKEGGMPYPPLLPSSASMAERGWCGRCAIKAA